jgi:DNA topoisomerase-1
MRGGYINNAEWEAEPAPVTAAAVAPRNGASPTTVKLARRLGLRHVSSDVLAIRRRRCGKGWLYLAPDGRVIRDRAIVGRLARLAVPPAYQDVLYAEDPAAHLQAIGRDAAGRLQYRYHADWEKVRETRKAGRLARLADVLPRIRRSVGQYLSAPEPTRESALAGVIELVACSAIRPGSDSYAKLHGTRGATTLLKSNVVLDGELIRLTFRAKGGKKVVKELVSPRLFKTIELLRQVPGRRLFQYRAENGGVRLVKAQEVNEFLRQIAGVNISLKDFRTLMASASVLEALARAIPGESEGQRRKQVLEAVRAAAEDLHNTPAICRRSYVHDSVVAAFEDGVLERFTQTLAGCRSPTRRAQVLAQIIAAAA